MIFYTKLTKPKRLNKSSFRASFTLIEILIVVIIIGILAYTLTFKFASNNIQAAADKLINDLRYTQSLALKDDKYHPYPENNTSVELNRSKYWFKQWWQLRFKISQGSYLYSIFSDSPSQTASSNFNLQPSAEEFAINPLSTKYASSVATSGTYSYGDYNLSKYNVKLIIRPDGTPYDSRHATPSLLFLFDNFGNVFTDEGIHGDAGDINPLDKNKRPLITQTINIKLCMDKPCNYSKERCAQINITPSGYVFKSICQ